MKGFVFACILLTAPVIVADKSKVQNNIEVPDPTKPPTSKDSSCADVNVPLLDIIKQLTDQTSVDNEVKYEQDHKLTADKIYQRRMSIIKEGVAALQAHKGGK